jgi:Ca-activated chloride channel family protein
MTFENFIWLALAPLFGILAAGIIAFGWRKRSHLLGQFAAPRLVETLTEKSSIQRLLIKAALVVAAVCAIAIALARPQYGVEWSERKARGLDIVFVLDSSRSMLATDLRPTRLDRAKLAILDLIDRLESDRIGLVAFAGQAFLQTPPTLDYGAFRESLNAIDPSILSRGGSDLGRAIEEAAKAFPTESNVKIVVLLTDGEDLGGRAVAAARTAAEAGIKIYAIGIGTPEGEYLRVRNEQGIEEFVRDSDGQPVRSQLDEATLIELARITGGSYSPLSSGSLETLYDSVLASLPREERESELQEVRIERFQWLLGAALLFLVLEILIRGRSQSMTKAGLIALSLMCLPLDRMEAETLRAHEAYNQAHAALTEGDFATANQLYTQAMQQSKDRQLQRDALFNMGHSTYQEALGAYNEGDLEAAFNKVKSAEGYFNSALELDPEDGAIAEDRDRTKQVREAIEAIVEQQQQQNEDQQSSEDSEQQEDGEDQQGENQEQANQDSQESEGENQDSQSGDSEPSEDAQGSDSSEPSPEEDSDGEQSSESSTEEEAESQESSEQSQAQDEESPGSDEEEQAPAPSEEDGSEEAASEPVPQVGESEEGDDAQGSESGAPVAPQAVEGMTLDEAQVLLDSLRQNEEILPFAKPVPGKGGPVQDW